MISATLQVDLDGLWAIRRAYGDSSSDPNDDDPVYSHCLPRLLEIFDQRKVRATLFVVGRDAEVEWKAALLRRASEAGHEIANHSYTHALNLGVLSGEELEQEIDLGRQAIEGACGIAPRGFRAPGYSISLQLLEQLEAKGSMPYLRKGFSGEATTIPPIQYVSQKRDRSGQAGQQVVWIEGFVYPIKDERGCIQQVVLIHNDISERVQAEAEREALIGELESQNAELERFTYTVSHDLKSPLITIKGFLGFLEQDARAGNVERVQADIARISAAAQRMEQLLSELLELSRIGRMVNPSEQVSFEELAQEALYMMEGRLDQRGVEARIAPELLRPDGPTVYGDRPRLREVLDNLVDNAIKFMGSQPHPQVEIGVRHDEKERVFYVRDNGMGIDPPYHEKVFGLFEKLDAETDGSGVGLAIVKRIVQVHGGRVWVESEGAGQGSTFCFTLSDEQGSTQGRETAPGASS